MTQVIFDIETDGLYRKVSKVHCLCLEIVGQGTFSYSDTPVEDERPLAEGLKVLEEADELIGHNIIGYDIPVLKKLFPGFNPRGKIYDTLVVTKLGFPCIETRDYAYVRAGKFPAKFIGRYSLEAWGHRLGIMKGQFCHQTDWQTYDADMLHYCGQDIQVSKSLWIYCLKAELPEEAIELEQEVRRIVTEQENFGWLFNREKAEALYITLSEKRQELLEQLQAIFPPWQEKTVFVPKRNNKTRGYVEGVPIERVTEVPFNPNSRPHIIRALAERYGWVPTEFTEDSLEAVEKGQADAPTPKTDEDVLLSLPYPEAKVIAEFMMIQKRIGMLAEGKVAWLKLIDLTDNRIHGSVDTLGARTRRMTHNNPNCAQVPASHSPYGMECRELFCVPEGYVQLGIDADGLELRCLAHFMARYDDGEYVKTVLDGKKEDKTDAHSRNAKALGLPRDDAKTWFYAFSKWRL